MIRTKGEPGTGDIIQAVRHIRAMNAEIRRVQNLRDDELYEAAKVDGANRWQQCLHVTLPCIRSTIVVMLIMQLGKLMGGSFERIVALSNAKATEYTTTIPVLVFKWFQGNKFSESTALGLFQSVIGVILVVASDKIAKKLGEDGLL